ncbi:MAG: hypothetical protein CSA81_08920 [Acidobacteria bacterium]|nr:MAG: hypothetical protein CSA81_08920 [Acidobacteriota bacterium]
MIKKLRDLTIYLALAALVSYGLFTFLPNSLLIRNESHPQTKLTEKDSFRVLYFHSERCPHCKLANPVIVKLQKKYPEAGWVIFNLSNPKPEDILSYHSWLKAAKLEEQVTPVIVIGPRNEPWMTYGFMNEDTDREPIENEIRRRLGLEPLHLKKEAIHFPISGFTILGELTPLWQSVLLGLLSGVLPSAFLCLLWFIMKTRLNRKNTLLMFLCYGLTALAGPFLFNTIRLNELLHTVLRLAAGVAWLTFTLYILMGYLKDEHSAFGRLTLTVKKSWLVFIGCLLLDLIQMTWLKELGQRLHMETHWQGALCSAMPMLLLAGLSFLVTRMRTRALPRYKIVYLAVLFLTITWALLLLTGHNFSGYGAWIVS